MKAVAVFPSKAHSAHLRDIPAANVSDIPGGRGVQVKVLKVGLCGTDREIDAGDYGASPPGSEFLVLGHENFGVVQEVGSQVTQLATGDYVVALVRHPGSSWYDELGMPDMSIDSQYHEHGISLLHGFLTEYYVDLPEQMVKVPAGLRDFGVLVEPLSVVEKGVTQAYEIQRRLRVWRPKVAAVMGAGPIGLLAALSLRLRGLDVVVFGLEEPPHVNSDLVQDLGGRYLSTAKTSLADAAKEFGPFDLMFEATGYSPLVFEAMEVLGKSGVLVLASVTSGNRTVEVPADAINMGFVLGNKVVLGSVNANRLDYETAVRDLAVAEARFPGWLPRLITHRVEGLENYRQALEILTGNPRPIKIVIEIAQED